MSVVHLEAHGDLHTRAKAFCKQNGLKMKEWVSGLILAAVAEDEGKRAADAVKKTFDKMEHVPNVLVR